MDDTKQLRLFLAVLIPDDVRSKIEAAVSPVRAQMQQVRWVRADLWHLTLVFLAYRPAAAVATIRDLASRVCRDEPPFGVRLDGIGCFPQANRPRVLWIGVCPGSDALATLQRHVCAALKDGGLEVADERFNAHLTIGRVRDEAGADVRAEIGRRWATTAVPRLPLYDVHEFHLMRSDLSPSGPRYTSLAAMPLLGSARA